jgi:hypothetical protein
MNFTDTLYPIANYICALLISLSHSLSLSLSLSHIQVTVPPSTRHIYSVMRSCVLTKIMSFTPHILWLIMILGNNWRNNHFLLTCTRHLIFLSSCLMLLLLLLVVEYLEINYFIDIYLITSTFFPSFIFHDFHAHTKPLHYAFQMTCIVTTNFEFQGETEYDD